jgi:hypothetical protein
VNEFGLARRALISDDRRMTAFLDMLIGQLLEPIALIITVIAGAICWRPPPLYLALVIAAGVKVGLLLALYSTAAARYPVLLLAAATAGVIGIAVGAISRLLINRGQRAM